MGVGAALLRRSTGCAAALCRRNHDGSCLGREGEGCAPSSSRAVEERYWSYLDFGPLAEGGLSFMPQFSPALPFESFLPFQ